MAEEKVESKIDIVEKDESKDLQSKLQEQIDVKLGSEAPLPPQMMRAAPSRNKRYDSPIHQSIASDKDDSQEKNKIPNH